MITSKQKNRLYDVVHKGWVYTCIGMTGLGVTLCAFQLYNYFMYIKPHKKEMEEQYRRELLQEGILKDPAAIPDS